MDVQMQAGGSDCGLFAIAFATAIVNGVPPGKFVFNQAKMTSIPVLDEWEIAAVPNSKRTKGRHSDQDQGQLCSCRMPEMQGVEMVECCQCREWFHVPQVPQAALKELLGFVITVSKQ